MLRTIQIRILILISSGLALSACSKTSFEPVPQACQAPDDSARFGQNAGPVILEPVAMSMVSGVVRIQGSCVSGLPVTIQEASGATQEVDCESEVFSARVELSNQDGLKDVIVSQNTKPDGKATVDRLCFMKDSTPPNLSLSQGTSAQNMSQTTPVVSGACEAGLDVLISGPGVQSPVRLKCQDGQFSTTVQLSPGDGEKNVLVSQVDQVGNQGQTSAKFTVDTTAPAIRITSPAPNTVTASALTVGGVCETGLRVNFGTPGTPNPETTDCVNGTFSRSLTLSGSDGSHTVRVYQVDLAGNVGTDSRNFTKDSSAPAITISLPLANAYLTPTSTFSGTCETGLPVELSGSALTSARTVPCTQGAWSLTSPVTNDQGVKTLMAAQTDTVGNRAQTQRSFLYDTVAPVLAFLSPEAGSYVGTSAQIEGTCETGLLVQITGAGVLTPATANCLNGRFTSSVLVTVADGVKAVVISQTDLAGNTGSATRSFVRDTGAPVLSITSPASNALIGNSVNVTGTCEAGLTVTLGGSAAALPVSVTCAANGTFSSSLAVSAGDGPKTLTATSTDRAQNTSQTSVALIKDTTAPMVAITTPDANTQGRLGLTIGGTCEAGLTVSLSGSGLSANSSTACAANGTFTAAITFSNNDGPKLITATQTDAAGNSGSGSQTFIRNTQSPAITITSPAANSYIGATFTLTGTCQTGLNVVLSGAGISQTETAMCASGTYSVLLTTSNGDGTKSVTATQTDAIGNTGSVSRAFLRDTGAPVLSVTSPANNSLIPATFTITGTCEAGLTVNFSGAGLNANSSTLCSAGGTYSHSLTASPGDGVKSVQVSETDLAGNTATVNVSYLRDSVAPVLAITSPAAGTEAQSGLTITGTCEAGLAVQISGSGTQSATTTTCPNGSFTAPVTFSAGDGPKAVTVTQTDAAGNTGSASQTFIRDTAAPAITIASPAANSYLGATFNLTGNCENGLPVLIAGAGIDAGGTVTCVNGAYSAALAPSAGDGVKTVTASQTDVAGNTATASRNFLRDTLAPVLTITSPANGTTVRTTVTLTGTCEAGLTVNFSGPGVASASSTVCAANGTYTSTLTTSVGDGVKVINLSESDAAGNTSQASGSYNKDTTGPSLAFTSPAPNTEFQTGATVTGTCEAGLTVTLTGALSSTVTTTCSASNTFSAPVIFSAGDGAKTITASQTDAIGNTGSASLTLVRDSTGPALAITSPAANSYIGATFTLTGTCQTGLTVTLSGAGIDAATANCVSGAFSANLTTSAGDGVKTVTASQTDTAGNTGSASRNFLRDTLAPVLTITSPANGTTVRTTVTLTGTCEAGLTVNFSGPGVASTSSTVCAANGTYTSTLTTSSGDGSKVINLSETDAAGNTAQTTGMYLKDTTAPSLAFTSPAAGTESQTGATVTGTCEAGLTVTLTGALSSTVTTTCSASNTFSAPVIFSAGDGAKTITASQTDSVGNTGAATLNLVRDTTAPILAITSPAANSYIGATFTLTGTCQTGLTVTLSGAGIEATTANCVSGAFSANLTASAGDGVKTVTASQTDTAGNTGSASRNFLRDSTPPALSITSPVIGSSVAPSVNIQGACETGASVVQITGDINSTVTGACSFGAYNIPVTFTAALGTKSVLVRQTDAAGNVGQASSQFLRDYSLNEETFVSDASFGKIDILFVDDNSASMDPQQASLGSRFSGFSSELLNIDWQIGITTTDCSTGPYGICGSLLTMTGAPTKILTPTVPNYQTVFNDTIRRPETVGCLDTGTCPSGNSQPLLSAMTAMNKRSTDNAGFFRGDSDLAVVILSDADEGQNSPAIYADRPTQLVNTFNSLWPSGKKLSVYSIIVRPGDVACLNQLTAANGGFSFYGNYINQAVNLTQGLSVSICAPDYTVTLRSIGESVRTLTNSVQLAHTPIAGSVNVTFTPNQNITYKVIGNKVVFDSPPAVGTQIRVSYQY